MKRWHKAALGSVAMLAMLAGAAYVWRTDLALAFIRYRSALPVAANRPVPWQAGPATAEVAANERPPNIIFVLFDDLGMNDLSTFGGGIAGGRIKTPNIDRLAAEGAIFTQSYAGNATCSPSPKPEMPYWVLTARPSKLSLKMKLTTPATASDP